MGKENPKESINKSLGLISKLHVLATNKQGILKVLFTIASEDQILLDNCAGRLAEKQQNSAEGMKGSLKWRRTASRAGRPSLVRSCTSVPRFTVIPFKTPL